MDQQRRMEAQVGKASYEEMGKVLTIFTTICRYLEQGTRSVGYVTSTMQKIVDFKEGAFNTPDYELEVLDLGYVDVLYADTATLLESRTLGPFGPKLFGDGPWCYKEGIKGSKLVAVKVKIPAREQCRCQVTYEQIRTMLGQERYISAQLPELLAVSSAKADVLVANGIQGIHALGPGERSVVTTNGEPRVMEWFPLVSHCSDCDFAVTSESIDASCDSGEWFLVKRVPNEARGTTF